MSKFADFTKNEFRDALGKIAHCEFPRLAYEFDWEPSNAGWVRVERNPPIQEYCYLIPLGSQRFFIKVYSSVDRRTGVTRDVGEDAIRLVASQGADFALKPIRPRFTRVNRVMTWRDNLRKRIYTILQSVGNDLQCHSCGGQMVVRSKSGENFLGCDNYRIKRCPSRNIIVTV